jgi:hypothetical protein
LDDKVRQAKTAVTRSVTGVIEASSCHDRRQNLPMTLSAPLMNSAIAGAERLAARALYSWQRRLLTEHLVRDYIPDAVDVPTGLGKTTVIALWLGAIAQGMRTFCTWRKHSKDSDLCALVASVYWS